MNKIFKLFKAISLIIKQPSLLNKVLDDKDVNKTEVVRSYHLPEGLKTIDLLDLFPDFEETVQPFCSLDGGSTPLDLALLKAIAKNKPECDYFEIGTWRGESVANVASVAKHCTTLNLPDKDMLEMGLDKGYVDLHRFFSKERKNVTHLQANSQTFDFSPHFNKYDLVFIDGDHHYESVKMDTQNAFRVLKDESSIIVWHDYGNTPNDIRWDVFKGILDGTPKGKINNLYRVSNTLCAIYFSNPMHSEIQKPYTSPNKTFLISLKAEMISRK